MKTVIHVNQHTIRSNQKNATLEPVLTVKDYQKNRYCHEAIILDDEGKELAKVVYSPEKPLHCGAKCWIETQHTVEVVRKRSENNTE